MAPPVVIRVFLERSVASVHAEAVQVLPFTEAVVVVDDDFVLADIDLVLIRRSRAGVARRALAQKVSGTLGRGKIGIFCTNDHICKDRVVNRIALHFDFGVGNGETTTLLVGRNLLH